MFGQTAEQTARPPLTRRAVRRGAVGLGLLSMCALLALAFAAPAAASPDPAEVPPEVDRWFDVEGHEAVAEDPEGDTYDEYLQGLGVEQVREQEIHEPHPVHHWSEEFVRGRSQDEEQAVAFEGEWIAAVSVNGDPAATLQADQDEDNGVAFSELTTAGDAAEGFLDLEEGEILIYEFPLNAWYAMSDGRLRGLNYEGRLEVPETVTLEEYAQRTQERYAEDLERPDDTDIVGGTAFTDTSSPMAWLLPAGIVALIVAGAAAVAFRRSGTKTG